MIPRTIVEAASLIRSGALSCVELTTACLARADELDPQLGAYIDRYDETALLAAKTLDDELVAGTDRGPLHGIPIGIKDNIACKEGVTTGNSVVYDPTWWAGKDAPVVERLRNAGAIITGKLTTMEYALGLPDPTKPYPLPRTPWDPSCWPGGSSSGSGLGVASGMFLGALGTDTGGSIRLPCSFNGISGIKQTFGLVPKSGCLPVGQTTDTICPMTTSAADNALMLGVLAGFDSSDQTMVPGIESEDYGSYLTGNLSGLTIGVEKAHHIGRPSGDPALEAVFDAAIAVLVEAGASVVEIDLPYYTEVTSANNLCWPVEAFAYHREWLAERWSDYGRSAREVLGDGALITAADYLQVQKVRRVGKAALDEIFRAVDLIVTPTTTTGAISYDELGWEVLFDRLCTPYWSAVGSPAMSVPMGFTNHGMPLGLQIAGPAGDDGLVLRAGDAFQKLTTYHLELPPIVAALV